MFHARPIAPWIVGLSLSLFVVLPGCGSSEVGPDSYSQEFEKPDVAPPVVTDPPDEGDALSPRERRARGN